QWLAAGVREAVRRHVGRNCSWAKGYNNDSAASGQMRAPWSKIEKAYSSMLFGHNSNVKVGDTVYHVQTEDRGASHAVIDTMVYHSGRVLHRRANSYADLLPLDAAREVSLKERVSAQHNAVMEELRSGALK